MTASDVAWGPKGADGTRTGTITVTVRNLSQVPANLVGVYLRMQVGTTADGGDWPACQGGPLMDPSWENNEDPYRYR